MGSSPLARGLQQGALGLGERPRIIPARAGFTRGARGVEEEATDHPRSRGVYIISPTLSALWSGSSPLARGLPFDLLLLIFDTRIIPARAGFTPNRVTAISLAKDHPRSRGVYLLVRSRSILSVGSSPLARGLLIKKSASKRITGIIPARAGFTM